MIYSIPVVFEVDSETGNVNICRSELIDPNDRTSFAGLYADTVYKRVPMGFKSPINRTLAETRDDIHHIVNAVLGYGN